MMDSVCPLGQGMVDWRSMDLMVGTDCVTQTRGGPLESKARRARSAGRPGHEPTATCEERRAETWARSAIGVAAIPIGPETRVKAASERHGLQIGIERRGRRKEGENEPSPLAATYGMTWCVEGAFSRYGPSILPTSRPACGGGTARL